MSFFPRYAVALRNAIVLEAVLRIICQGQSSCQGKCATKGILATSKEPNFVTLQETHETCPICGCKLDNSQALGEQTEFECPNCGSFSISRTTLTHVTGLDQHTKAVLSHGIWKRQEVGKGYKVTRKWLNSAKEVESPDPATQLDLLILYLGDNQESPGKNLGIPSHYLKAKIGAINNKDIAFTLECAESKKLVTTEMAQPRPPEPLPTLMRLTLDGWQRYHEIQRGAVTSRTAFMAMPFSNKYKLQEIYKDSFRPAVEQTGFKLRRVDEEQPAGLIDDHIRVGIRLSMFVVADLTGGNQGVYWEAGYAEGLGNKPVIYTCNKEWFEQHETHFDTNHLMTILWDPANPEKAVLDLKATIRATLPFEARMEDEPSGDSFPKKSLQ